MADSFTLCLLADLSEKERKLTFERNKSALESKKGLTSAYVGKPKNLTLDAAASLLEIKEAV
ncbi:MULTISPECIES: hypothetical protein [Pontibacter]|uniref:Uncharacterized protein n=1 Tax=Pontibacter rugosus TaxID=1745966 RepID=A0ABW3SPU3_9BACT|nr:hypothetical protein [Pontibacter ummariensis]